MWRGKFKDLFVKILITIIINVVDNWKQLCEFISVPHIMEFVMFNNRRIDTSTSYESINQSPNYQTLSCCDLGCVLEKRDIKYLNVEY